MDEIREIIGNTTATPINMSEINEKLNNKVDKENGKGLSSNDYTDADQAKVNIIKIDEGSNKFLAGNGEYRTISGGGGMVEETDPTVPDWAKQSEKPKYDYSEIENTPDLTEYEKTANVDAKLGNKVDYETFGQAIGSIRTENKEYTDIMCNGANKAVSFVNYSSMIESFKGIRLTDPSKSPYNIGQNVMIVTLEVPDLWVSDLFPQYIDYNYTSDSDFVNELKTNGSVQVGNYVFSALETQKVDLTDYAEMAYVDNHKMPIPTNSVKDNEYVITYNPAKNVSSVNTLVKASASGIEAPYQLSFVKVNEYGQLTTADPTGDYHCTNKKYVDGELSTKLPFPTNKGSDKAWDFLVGYNPSAKTTTGYDVSTASEDGSSAPATNAVIRANKNRQIGTADPTGDYHCTNKKYVDSGLSNKVEKITGSANNRDVYANIKGVETVIPVQTSYSNATNGVIAVYKDKTEQAIYSPKDALLTCVPEYDYHCANKKYVDGKVGDIDTALDEIVEIQEAYLGGGGSNKVLSSNDYTDADKTKVDKIITNGDGNSYLANDGTYKAVQGGSDNVVVIQAQSSGFKDNAYYPILTVEDGNNIVDAYNQGKSIVIKSKSGHLWTVISYDEDAWSFVLMYSQYGLLYYVGMGICPPYVATDIPPTCDYVYRIITEDGSSDGSSASKLYRKNFMIEMEDSNGQSVTAWVNGLVTTKSAVDAYDVINTGLLNGLTVSVNQNFGIIQDVTGTEVQISFFDKTLNDTSNGSIYKSYMPLNIQPTITYEV